MTGGHALDVVDTLAPIDLDELSSVADLQTRRDRKYLVPHEYVPLLVTEIDGRALEVDGLRSFRYESVYFDTTDLHSYLGAARRRPRRFKVRTRAYLDTGDCMLEVKCRDGRSRTVKHRHPYAIDRRAELTDAARAFVGAVEASSAMADALVPTLTVTHRRATLVLRTGDARVTLDVDLAWHHSERPSLELPRLAVIETKTANAPSAVDRMLWRAGHRPIAMSKYCTGLAALNPDLPANKWHRTLQRHFRASVPQFRLT